MLFSLFSSFSCPRDIILIEKNVSMNTKCKTELTVSKLKGAFP